MTAGMICLPKIKWLRSRFLGMEEKAHPLSVLTLRLSAAAKPAEGCPLEPRVSPRARCPLDAAPGL